MTTSNDDADSGSSADRIEAALRRTPFHRWHEVRRVADDDTFRSAAASVRAEWSTDRLIAEIRGALTAVATHLVLAMPHPDTEPEAVGKHLGLADQALAAAEHLAPSLPKRTSPAA